MYKKCHTAQSARRQREIAEVFMRMVQETDLEQLRIADLCREAGIARKVFYRYFDGKEDVLSYLEDVLYGEIRLQLMPDVPFRPEAVRTEDCVSFCRFWQERRLFLNFLMDERYTAFFQQRLLERFRAEYPQLSQQMQQNWRRMGIASFLLNGTVGLLRFWRDEDFRQSPEELGQLLRQLLGHVSGEAPWSEAFPAEK